MYSMHVSADYARRSRELGAAGYLIKGQPLATLLQAIRAVAGGHDAWHLGMGSAMHASEPAARR
jgi:DNA-binding NarL/FixJ family response regulator